MELGTVFTDYSVKKLQQLADRIDDCLQRLEDSEIWWRKAGAQNAAGNLVLHLCGNLGQWIGTGVGGNPDKRRRDEEFRADGGVSREELRERLRDRVTESCRWRPSSHPSSGSATSGKFRSN